MKANLRFGCAVCLLASAFALRAQKAAAAPRLKGIAVFSTNQLALLEVAAPQRWRGELILAKGQRDGDVEVLEIDPAAGKVRIHDAGEIVDLSFDPDSTPEAAIKPSSGAQEADSLKAPAFLRLQQAGPGHVFSLYQLLVNRTLIRPASLPDFQLDLYSKEPATTADLASGIEQALAQRGIVIQPEGEKFTVAGRAGEAGKITPEVRQLAAMIGAKVPQASTGARAEPKTVPNPSTEEGEELLPQGVICFRAADLDQVLEIYQDLTDRTLLRPPAFRVSTISLLTCTPLTKNEAIFAFNALLAVNDISVIPAGEKFLCVFPTAETNKVAALLTRKSPAAPVSDGKTLPAGNVHFRSAELRQFLAVYQDLCGGPVEIDAGVPNTTFSLNSQTPLMRDEILHGMDLLLGLHGLAVVPQGDGKSLKVVRLE